MRKHFHCKHSLLLTVPKKREHPVPGWAAGGEGRPGSTEVHQEETWARTFTVGSGTQHCLWLSDTGPGVISRMAGLWSSESPIKEVLGVWALDWLICIRKAHLREPGAGEGGGAEGQQGMQEDKAKWFSYMTGLAGTRSVHHMHVGQMLKHQINKRLKRG